MKHFHILMAVLTILLFIYSSYAILSKKPLPKALMATSHVIYLLVVITGGYLLLVLSQVAGVQHWAYAKIALLIAAISAIIKARRSPKQAFVGVLITWVALFGVVILAYTKPIL